VMTAPRKHAQIGLCRTCVEPYVSRRRDRPRLLSRWLDAQEKHSPQWASPEVEFDVAGWSRERRRSPARLGSVQRARRPAIRSALPSCHGEDGIDGSHRLCSGRRRQCLDPYGCCKRSRQEPSCPCRRCHGACGR